MPTTFDGSKQNKYALFGSFWVCLWLVLVQILFFSILERHSKFVQIAMAAQARQQTGQDQTLFAQGLAEHVHLRLISCLQLSQAGGATVLDMGFLGPCSANSIWLSGTRVSQTLQTLNGLSWNATYTVLPPAGLIIAAWLCRILGSVAVILICLFLRLRDRTAAALLAHESARTEEIARISRQVGHDIRSPIGALAIVVRKSISPEEPAYKVASSAIVRMDSIVKDLLAGGVRKKTELTVAVSSFDANDLINRIVNEKKLSVRPEMSWRFSAGSLAGAFRISESDFERLVSNLIQNSVDATSSIAKPIIEIELQMTADEMIFAIQDNGSGIPEDVLLRILNGESLSFGKSSGHGLGLSSARKLAESVGGRLEIWSKPGEGTRVSVFTPLVLS